MEGYWAVTIDLLRREHLKLAWVYECLVARWCPEWQMSKIKTLNRPQ